MAPEMFKRRLGGWLVSSDGYSIRLLGRSNLRYVDDLGSIRLFAEPMANPWSAIVVDTSAIPDQPERTRQEVVARLGRGFAQRGWTLIEAHSGQAVRGLRDDFQGPWC
jgi:hypothetical protein